jgi:ubiquitin-like 1-activating enzyme E1 A
VRKLNPRVKVNVITRDVRAEKDATFFTAYDVIIATDLDFDSTRALDSGASLADTPFYAGASHGFFGYIFADLGKNGHEFVVEREKSNRPTLLGAETATRSVISTATKKENGKAIEMVTKRERYTPLTLVNSSPLPLDVQNNMRKLRKVHPLLTCIRTLWEYQHLKLGVYPSHSHEDLQLFTQLATRKHAELGLPAETLKADLLRSFLQNLGSELAPVTAFLGGQLAQDVINVLGKREQPIQNLMLFDGEESVGPIYTLHHNQFSDAVKAAVPVAPAGAEIVIL